MTKPARGGPINQHQREVANDLLSQFPDAATKTLARMAYRDHGSLWTSLDACRSYFRTLRGAKGTYHRRATTDQSHYRDPVQPGDPFKKLPEPKREFEEWLAIRFEGPIRALVISDPHIPFYDKPALVCALRHGQAQKANFILLNGDICDAHSISDFVKDPRMKNFPAEIRAVKDFLIALREMFPRARIVYKLGNHEERFERYMFLKAPELLGIPDFEFSSIFGLADYDIQLVSERRPIQLGKLNVIHGHEYTFAISNPVSAARGLFLRAKVHATCGHFHRTSQFSDATLEQDVISTWSAGALCDLHPRYNPINSWNHGFQMVHVDKDGAFEVSNMRIVHGKAYQ